MDRRSFVLGAPVALAGCGGAVYVWAPDDVINRAVSRGTGPKSLNLLTMRNTGSGNGAHSSLVIDASQRIIFDPAGSFSTPSIPERNDVLFGISPQIEQFYISYHARSSFYVEAQKIDVTPEVAEQAMRLALAYGAVPQGACTRATSSVLQQLPGFESLRVTYFPNNLRDRFANIPGVSLREYRETDGDDNSIAAAQINARLTAGR